MNVRLWMEEMIEIVRCCWLPYSSLNHQLRTWNQLIIPRKHTCILSPVCLIPFRITFSSVLPIKIYPDEIHSMFFKLWIELNEFEYRQHGRGTIFRKSVKDNLLLSSVGPNQAHGCPWVCCCPMVSQYPPTNPSPNMLSIPIQYEYNVLPLCSMCHVTTAVINHSNGKAHRTKWREWT